ncbi:MAG: transcriptional regulatory protein [Bacteroidota bacterium]|jgi:two-component system alkaline phosphatase synthesis response regulator PhoP|nr:transcriptional regulatory protein [Bacteroidota bacterium]
MSQSFQIIICSNTESSIKKTADFLKEKNYLVSFAKSDEDLYSSLKKGNVNLVIVELDYIFRDGISITSDIRNLKEIEQPYIILFSNKQDDYIQITAFNAGADDFIITPIKPILLEARIATLKKRLSNKTEEISEANKHPDFYVDKEQYLVITKAGKISLPRKEFEMLTLMYENNHKIFTRQDFARLIWNMPIVANSRTIDIHIRNIRRLLGSDVIRTMKGVGYFINRDLI